MQPDIDYVLVLSGDQLYRMDYNTMIESHEKSSADVTIAALPVERQQAAGFGIMRLDDTGRVVGFLEKPKTDAELKLVHTDPSWIDARGIKNTGVRDRMIFDAIYFEDPLGLLIELSCWKFDAPEGFSRADVLFAAHQLRVARGDRAIKEVHLADAIEGLVQGARKSLSADRSPKDPYRR